MANDPFKKTLAFYCHDRHSYHTNYKDLQKQAVNCDDHLIRRVFAFLLFI